MHLTNLLAVCTLSCSFVLSVCARQATRQDVVVNSYKKRAGELFARASSVPCANLVDGTGYCCATNEVLRTVSDGSQCCSTSVYEPNCSETACCAGGAAQILTGGSQERCCPSGTRPDTTLDDCVSVTRKRNELAFDLATRPVKRGTIDDPLKQISFRPDSWRMTLSPHLVADLLMNDWSFEYRVYTFVDEVSRARGRGYWQSRIAKNLPGFVKYKGADYIAKSIQKLHAAGEQYLSLADDYEVTIEDIPLIWGALLDHPSWDGAFHLEGAKWDQDMIKRIVSSHPSWNATLHDRI